MTTLFVHGMNMGDTIFAAQGIYNRSPSIWVTDIYNRPLIEWLIHNTDCPVVRGIYMTTEGSDHRSKHKFRPYVKYALSFWDNFVKSDPELDREIDDIFVSRVKLNHSNNSHVINQLNFGDPAVVIKTHRGLDPKKRIVLSCESWNKDRWYDNWDLINFPEGYEVVELCTKDNCGGHFQTRFPKVEVSSMDDTEEVLRTASAVIGVSSFTGALSASLGIPTIMLTPTQKVAVYNGVSPWGGIDLLTSAHPDLISKSLETLIDA